MLDRHSPFWSLSLHIHLYLLWYLPACRAVGIVSGCYSTSADPGSLWSPTACCCLFATACSSQLSAGRRIPASRSLSFSIGTSHVNHKQKEFELISLVWLKQEACGEWTWRWPLVGVHRRPLTTTRSSPGAVEFRCRFQWKSCHALRNCVKCTKQHAQKHPVLACSGLLCVSSGFVL